MGRRSRKTKGDQEEEEAAKCFSKHALRLPLSFFLSRALLTSIPNNQFDYFKLFLFAADSGFLFS